MIDENGVYRYRVFKAVYSTSENGYEKVVVAGFGDQTIIEDRDGETWIVDPVKGAEYKVDISKADLDKSLKDFPDSLWIDGVDPREKS